MKYGYRMVFVLLMPFFLSAKPRVTIEQVKLLQGHLKGVQRRQAVLEAALKEYARDTVTLFKKSREQTCCVHATMGAVGTVVAAAFVWLIMQTISGSGFECESLGFLVR